MRSLFITGLLEEFCKTWETDVIAVEISKERVVDIRDIVFNVDLVIDGGLASSSVSLAGEGFRGRGRDFNELVLDFKERLEDDTGEARGLFRGSSNNTGETKGRPGYGGRESRGGRKGRGKGKRRGGESEQHGWLWRQGLLAMAEGLHRAKRKSGAQ